MNCLPSLIKDVLVKIIGSGCVAAYFDFPNYSNVGDSAIWLGGEKVLKTELGVNIIYQDDVFAFKRGFPEFDRSTIILISGGGNFGDLWEEHQLSREYILRAYPNNLVVQLPQSIYFKSNCNFEKSRQFLSAHKDFHLLVRDHESLKIGKKLHKGETLLCPDMALCLGKLTRTVTSSFPILGLLRDDIEKNIESPENNKQSNFYYLDWIKEPMMFNSVILSYIDRLIQKFNLSHKFCSSLKLTIYNQLANKRLRRGCNILSSGKIVITDRLHAHILCTLLNIPHVVLDNSYRKIGNFRKVWHTGEGLCKTATTLDEAINKAYKMLY